MTECRKLLLIEDDQVDARAVIRMLRPSGDASDQPSIEVVHADCLRTGLESLSEGRLDFVLLDLGLPDSIGLGSLDQILAKAPHLPVIVLTGNDDQDAGVEAIGKGAQDYLVKGKVDADLLRRAIRYAMERKRAEQELAETAAELARSNRELEQFAYVISHDLQAPLRSVSSFARLLSKRYGGQLDEKADQFITHIVDGAKTMQGLIADLLALSRVGTQDQPADRVDCSEALDQAVENLRAAIEESGAVLNRAELPAVAANRSQLVQIFQNLVGNAIKYRAEAAPVIEVSAKLEGGEWTFSVRDNGIGMEAPYLEEIFLVFRRLHGPDEYSGSGIGLAICKKIVELHGGRIWAESAPGKGSTFCFTIGGGDA